MLHIGLVNMDMVTFSVRVVAQGDDYENVYTQTKQIYAQMVHDEHEIPLQEALEWGLTNLPTNFTVISISLKETNNEYSN